MAKIIEGPLGQISGTLGTSTYSRNRYGLYVKTKSSPVNPNSARQSAVRTIFADLAQHWQNTLSSAQRSAWEDYAANLNLTDRFGKAQKIGGMNHYLRTNIAALSVGVDRIDDGPTTFTLPGADPLFSIAADSATGDFTVTFDDALDWCDEDGAALLIHGGRPVAPTRNFYNSPWRLSVSVLGDNASAPTSTATVASPYTLSAGNNVFTYARILRADGRLSSPFRTQAVCS